MLSFNICHCDNYAVEFHPFWVSLENPVQITGSLKSLPWQPLADDGLMTKRPTNVFIRSSSTAGGHGFQWHLAGLFWGKLGRFPKSSRWGWFFSDQQMRLSDLTYELKYSLLMPLRCTWNGCEDAQKCQTCDCDWAKGQRIHLHHKDPRLHQSPLLQHWTRDRNDDTGRQEV